MRVQRGLEGAHHRHPALAGFLPFNFPRARIFLGDAGSHLVGYLLATLATTYMKKNDYAAALAIRQSMMDRLPAGSAAAAKIAMKMG